MAEQLISPGSLLREQDRSILPPQIIESDFAIVGPTAKGPVNIPTRITSYSEYVAIFGEYYKETIGDKIYKRTFLTTISIFNYFQNGGASALVTRVVNNSATWGAADVGVGDGEYGIGTLILSFETLAKGADQNSATEGTSDNVKVEITNVNTTTGTFSVLVRRGDDTDNNKQILESFSNLNLDPDSNNFISKRIGNVVKELKTDGDINYIQPNGDYPNNSRYIRVKSTDVEMYDYDPDTILSGTDTWGDVIESLEDVYSFDNGTGTLLSDGSFYHEIADASGETQAVMPSDYSDAVLLMKNEDEYRFNIIVTPGLIYQSTDHGAVINNLLSIIKQRGDAIYVIDTNEFESSVSTVAQSGGSIDSSYGAAYWPWLQITDPVTTKNVWIPASTLIPGVYKFTDTTGETWDAPAGITRGGLSMVIQAERKVTVSQRNTLYNSGINSIGTFPGVGVVVFGNKTLQNAASATDRVNVRRLLIELKGIVKRIADTIVFEPNSISTRNNFLNAVNPRMESIKQRNGLFAYKVVMDETNNTPDVIDRNELYGAIYIQPTRTAEFIYIDFVIQPTGAEFPE